MPSPPGSISLNIVSRYALIEKQCSITSRLMTIGKVP
jgi:hypothetical protein